MSLPPTLDDILNFIDFFQDGLESLSDPWDTERKVQAAKQDTWESLWMSTCFRLIHKAGDTLPKPVIHMPMIGFETTLEQLTKAPKGSEYGLAYSTSYSEKFGHGFVHVWINFPTEDRPKFVDREGYPKKGMIEIFVSRFYKRSPPQVASAIFGVISTAVVDYIVKMPASRNATYDHAFSRELEEVHSSGMKVCMSIRCDEAVASALALYHNLLSCWDHHYIL
jgi:hypothetical protein